MIQVYEEWQNDAQMLIGIFFKEFSAILNCAFRYLLFAIRFFFIILLENLFFVLSSRKLEEINDELEKESPENLISYYQ